MRAAVDFIAQLAGKTDPVHHDRHAADEGFAGVAELERLRRDVVAANAAEQLPRVRAGKRDPVPVRRLVLVTHCFGQCFGEKPGVRVLHRSRTEEHETLFAKAGDGQVAVKPPLLRQHRGQRDAARFGDETRHRPFQPRPRARSFDQMLCEIGDFDPTHGLAHRLALRRHIVVGPVAPEGRILPRVLRPVREPERMLKPEGLPHPRTLRDQPVVKRRGLLAAALGQGFIRESHDEATLVILGRLHRAPVGGGPVPEPRDVHRPDVDGRLPVDHPFRHGQADAAALTEPGHDAHGAPVVLHPRHRPDHRVTVRAECEGAVDRLADAGVGDGGDALEPQFQPVGDALKVGVQQLMPEIPWRAADFPRRPLRLIGAEQHPVPFLPEIDIRLIVDAAGQAAPGVLHLVNAFGQQIVMLHRLHGDVQPGHMPDLPRPEAAAVDDIFRVHHALGRGHVPCPVGALGRRRHRRMGEILRTIVAGRFGEGVGRAGRVQIAVLIVPERGVIVLRVDQRVAILQFLQVDPFLMKAHIARLRPLALQIVPPCLVGGEVEPAGHVEAHGLARKLLNLLVEADRVALQAGDVRVGRDRVDLPGGVPRGTRSQLIPLQQDHVLPAELRKVEEDRTPDHAAADDGDFRMGRELFALARLILLNVQRRLRHHVGHVILRLVIR